MRKDFLGGHTLQFRDSNPEKNIDGNFGESCIGRNKEAFLRIKNYGAAGFITLAIAISAISAQTPGSTPSAPAMAGTAITGILECGEGYTSHELYDMKITLLEVLRGEEAWKRLQAVDASNKPAESGFEYLLARVKFEYQARQIPGLCMHPLAPNQFTAYNAKGEDYAPVSVIPPKPEMRKELKSGDSVEGWLVFAVSKADLAPLMSFSASDGGAVQHAEPKWFLLR